MFSPLCKVGKQFGRELTHDEIQELAYLIRTQYDDDATSYNPTNVVWMQQIMAERDKTARAERADYQRVADWLA